VVASPGCDEASERVATATVSYRGVEARYREENRESDDRRVKIVLRNFATAQK
jgi:hypothetical protein